MYYYQSWISSSDVTVFQSFENMATEATKICVIFLGERKNMNIIWDLHSDGYEKYLLAYNAKRSVKTNRGFGGTYHLLLQGRTIRACYLHSRKLLFRLIFQHWRWSRYVPLKRRLIVHALHGVYITWDSSWLLLSAGLNTQHSTVVMMSVECWVLV
jgi:hypothetical protein